MKRIQNDINNQYTKQINSLLANQWCPCKQNNRIINLYTMITIIYAWFKTYMTYTDKWHELVQVNLESKYLKIYNRIGGVMVSVLSSSAVYRGFVSRSGQTKDNTIGICCFSGKHTALRWKSKDWLARNQNNVSEWSDMSTHGLLS